MEKQSDLTGSAWTTSAQYLHGNGLISRATSAGAEYHHPDISGVNGVITNSAGSIESSNVYDKFGVTQAAQGTAQTPWRVGQSEEEAMIKRGNANYAPAVAQALRKPGTMPKRPSRPMPIHMCAPGLSFGSSPCSPDQTANCQQEALTTCVGGAIFAASACFVGCASVAFGYFPCVILCLAAVALAMVVCDLVILALCKSVEKCY